MSFNLTSLPIFPVLNATNKIIYDAKDSQPEVMVTLIRSIVEQIYIIDREMSVTAISLFATWHLRWL